MTEKCFDSGWTYWGVWMTVIVGAPFGIGNPITDAVLVVLFAAIIAVFRNWCVHGPSFRLRYMFVGSDLVIGFIGIGALLLLRMLYEYLRGASTPNEMVELALGSSSIFVSALPLFVASFLTERRMHGPPFSGQVGALGVNLVSGVFPLFAAVYLVSAAIGGFRQC